MKVAACVIVIFNNTIFWLRFPTEELDTSDNLFIE